MIGSHNTFSYLPTKNILKKWGRCQEIGYKTQYDCGVRFFDVRIKFRKDGELQIVHNNITYKDGRNQLNRFLAFADKAGDCYIRVILDIRKKPKDAEVRLGLFRKWVKYIKGCLPNIKIAEAIVYWDWSYIVEPTLKITENHASVTNNVGIFKTPKRYARKNNDLILSMNREIAESENEVLLIDFVNIK